MKKEIAVVSTIVILLLVMVITTYAYGEDNYQLTCNHLLSYNSIGEELKDRTGGEALKLIRVGENIMSAGLHFELTNSKDINPEIVKQFKSVLGLYYNELFDTLLVEHLKEGVTTLTLVDFDPDHVTKGWEFHSFTNCLQESM